MANIDFAVGENCYNLYQSYGEICVGCGCCSNNKKKRLKARIELHEQLLRDAEHFELWSDDPEIKALQDKNIATDIAFHKGRIEQYKEELRGVK